MSQPKVSVIVVAYNAEKTLSRCLDSLKAQTLQEIEFVCVNDGSQDSTPAIMDAYAAEDPRFRVYHKANEGVSATRQFGMDHICGEYVIHLDSDDYAEPDAYGRLYEKAVAEKADLVICDAERLSVDGARLMDYSSVDLSAEGLIKRMFSWETSALWNRLVRSELVTRYSLRFPAYLQLAEDRYWLTCLLGRSLKAGERLRIVHLDGALIHYDQISNPDSLTRALDMKVNFKRMVESYQVLMGELDMSLFGREYYSFVLELAFEAFWKFRRSGLTPKDFQALFGPFESGFRVYVPADYRKTLVMMALRRGVLFAELFKWMAVPAILRDKIKL